MPARARLGIIGDLRRRTRMGGQAAQPWAPCDDKKLLELVAEHGRRWCSIANRFSGRSARDVASRHRRIKKEEEDAGDNTAQPTGDTKKTTHSIEEEEYSVQYALLELVDIMDTEEPCECGSVRVIAHSHHRYGQVGTVVRKSELKTPSLLVRFCVDGMPDSSGTKEQLDVAHIEKWPPSTSSLECAIRKARRVVDCGALQSSTRNTLLSACRAAETRLARLRAAVAEQPLLEAIVAANRGVAAARRGDASALNNPPQPGDVVTFTATCDPRCGRVGRVRSLGFGGMFEVQTQGETLCVHAAHAHVRTRPEALEAAIEVAVKSEHVRAEAVAAARERLSQLLQEMNDLPIHAVVAEADRLLGMPPWSRAQVQYCTEVDMVTGSTDSTPQSLIRRQLTAALDGVAWSPNQSLVSKARSRLEWLREEDVDTPLREMVDAAHAEAKACMDGLAEPVERYCGTDLGECAVVDRRQHGRPSDPSALEALAERAQREGAAAELTEEARRAAEQLREARRQKPLRAVLRKVEEALARTACSGRGGMYYDMWEALLVSGNPHVQIFWPEHEHHLSLAKFTHSRSRRITGGTVGTNHEGEMIARVTLDGGDEVLFPASSLRHAPAADYLSGWLSRITGQLKSAETFRGTRIDHTQGARKYQVLMNVNHIGYRRQLPRRIVNQPAYYAEEGSRGKAVTDPVLSELVLEAQRKIGLLRLEEVRQSLKDHMAVPLETLLAEGRIESWVTRFERAVERGCEAGIDVSSAKARLAEATQAELRHKLAEAWRALEQAQLALHADTADEDIGGSRDLPVKCSSSGTLTAAKESMKAVRALADAVQKRIEPAHAELLGAGVERFEGDLECLRSSVERAEVRMAAAASVAALKNAADTYTPDLRLLESRLKAASEAVQRMEEMGHGSEDGCHRKLLSHIERAKERVLSLRARNTARCSVLASLEKANTVPELLSGLELATVPNAFMADSDLREVRASSQQQPAHIRSICVLTIPP